jgi:hypothetical protein
MKSDAFLFTAPVVMATILALACLMITDCATPSYVSAGYPALHLMPVLQGETVFHIDDANKEMAISEGIPASFLAIKDSRGWQLTREHEIMAADMIGVKRNPGINYPLDYPTPVPASAVKPKPGS